MSDLMKSVDAYIEFAEATKRFADLAFYNRVKLALAKADRAEELVLALEAIKKHQEIVGGNMHVASKTWHISNKALANYREAMK